MFFLSLWSLASCEGDLCNLYSVGVPCNSRKIVIRAPCSNNSGLHRDSLLQSGAGARGDIEWPADTLRRIQVMWSSLPLKCQKRFQLTVEAHIEFVHLKLLPGNVIQNPFYYLILT